MPRPAFVPLLTKPGLGERDKYKNISKDKPNMETSPMRKPSKTKPRAGTQTKPKTGWRPRGPGTPTKTKPKAKGITRVIKQKDKESISYHTTGSKIKPRIIYDLFKNNQRYEVSGIDSVRVDVDTYGKQAVHIMNTHPSTTSLYNTTLDRALGRAATGNERNTSRVTFGTEKIITTYTNQEITPCYLDIYEIEPRFHISNININPLTAWIEGNKYETDGAVDISALVYQSPFRSSYFANYFKVHKILRIDMQPGGVHKHISTYHHNKGLHGIVTINHPHMRDFSHFRMHVVSGTPINDKIAVGNVSTSTIALDIVQQAVYDFTYSNVLRDKFINVNNLPQIVNQPDVISMFTKQPETES